MQKYELSRQTHKMTMVLRLKLCKILLFARIAYENTFTTCVYFCMIKFEKLTCLGFEIGVK